MYRVLRRRHGSLRKEWIQGRSTFSMDLVGNSAEYWKVGLNKLSGITEELKNLPLSGVPTMCAAGGYLSRTPLFVSVC